MKRNRMSAWRIVGSLLALFLLYAFPAAALEQIVVYSGRAESLIGPALEQFTQATGIQVSVRYGGTTELAAAILEEGRNSPADVFISQDAGALGALEKEGRLARLPEELLSKVDERLRSADGRWVAVSGRARVVAYSTARLAEEDLPDSVWGFTDPKWRGRIGWPPTNASFQAFVTALRVLEGEERAEAWLRGILANNPRVYPNNAAIVEAISRGEIDVGFVNHYYLYRFLAEQGDAFPVRNHHTRGDAGAIINVAGVAILETSRRKEAAERLVEWLLSAEAQRYFAAETHEYPVVLHAGISVDPRLVPLEEIETPDLDLSDLDDLEGTLEMLQRVGVL